MSELSQEKRDELIERLARASTELRQLPDGQERVNLKARLRFLARLIWLDGKSEDDPRP
jgi:hypothetical protein